uniref:Uncharacterized protein n=1 Tax=Tetranychus urticae TaxID=32264 RepID=T1K2W0_TETUR
MENDQNGAKETFFQFKAKSNFGFSQICFNIFHQLIIFGKGIF